MAIEKTKKPGPAVRRKRPKVFRESPDMSGMVGRVAKGMVVRAKDGDLEALTALRDMEAAIHEAYIAAGAALHAEPFAYSFTEIGREVGISRQAAQQMFGAES